MPNASKDKGDRAEREAIKWLREHYPHLLVWNADRLLGAGRMEDVGDLNALDDAVIQVKAYKDTRLSAGLYSAASGATIQAANSRMPYSTGMVVVPRARAHQVRWAAAADRWPAAPPTPELHTSSLAALAAVRAAGPASPLITQVNRRGSAPIFIACMHTWMAAYASAHIATKEP